MDSSRHPGPSQDGLVDPMDRNPDFAEAQRAVFEAVDRPVDSRFVDLPEYGRVQVLETGDSGDGPPLLFVHGVMNFGAMFAPLMAHLEDARMLALDRPGWGLSDGFRYGETTHRETATDVLRYVLEALDIEQVDLVGHSTGGYWGLTFALDHPDRVRNLFLVGGVPAFPGTRSPIPLRLFAIPFLARFLLPEGHPTEETVVEQLSVVGETETMPAYPELVAARVAHDQDPRSLQIAVSELRSFMTLRGWRSTVELSRSAIRSLDHPTTVIWGDNDLLGSPASVRAVINSMPDSRLHTLESGHIPWLGHAERCARIILDRR